MCLDASYGFKKQQIGVYQGEKVVATPVVWLRSTRRRREAGLAECQSLHKHFTNAGEMHDVPSSISPSLAPIGAMVDDPAVAFSAQQGESSSGSAGNGRDDKKRRYVV